MVRPKFEMSTRFERTWKFPISFSMILWYYVPLLSMENAFVQIGGVTSIYNFNECMNSSMLLCLQTNFGKMKYCYCCRSKSFIATDFHYIRRIFTISLLAKYVELHVNVSCLTERELRLHFSDTFFASSIYLLWTCRIEVRKTQLFQSYYQNCRLSVIQKSFLNRFWRHLGNQFAIYRTLENSFYVINGTSVSIISSSFIRSNRKYFTTRLTYFLRDKTYLG